VDATFGGGGHSREVLSRLGEKGRLIAFDQDSDAQENTLVDDRFEFVSNNFRFLKNSLRFKRIETVDGILADLGVSSHQFDDGSRGFSIRTDGGLDMRMNQSADLDALRIVNEYSEKDLTRVFREYGEVKGAHRVASRIVFKREEGPVESTLQLVEMIKSLAGFKKENQFLAQVFQALRIEVNDELNSLKEFLVQSAEVLKEGGKLVVISYHSLEDRLVKQFMKTGTFSSEMKKDFYGNVLRPFSPAKGGVISPDTKEIDENNRARSAKLRIGIRNARKE
jgi:16S rRNA (cytosine1402-N4)-methyltransferase